MISRAELGKFPIQIKVHAQMVKYFVRLAQGTSDDLLNDAFKCTMGNNSQWVQTITTILKSVGYAYVLNDPFVVNKDKFHRKLLQRLKDMYLQELRYTPSTRVKDYMRFYTDVNKYEFQNCQERVTNVEHRRTFTRLKLGVNCLFLEKGRYENLERNCRSCPLCKEGIEDLEHFIFRYPRLADKRKRFLEHLYTYTGGTFKFRPFTFQLRKIFTLDFKDKAIVPIITKGLFIMYKAREKLEEERMKDR